MRVALFSTCLVDQLFPQVGLAVLRVLKRVGHAAEFPRGQTCCGQPFFNSGYRDHARRLARVTLEALEEYDAVVVPSGSCAAMIRVQFPSLFPDPDPLHARMDALAAKTWEFSQFLTERLGVVRVAAAYSGVVTYHDGCHLLRELGVRDGPRELIRGVAGCQLRELNESDACCGFGGTFAVKFEELSSSMGRAKAQAVADSGADTLVSCDPSCLMQIGGLLRREGSSVRILHLAELLAGEPQPAA